MAVNRDSYCYHGTAKSIYHGQDDETGQKFCVIKAYGRCEVPDESKESGRRLVKQDMTIFARGGLAIYIESEIDEGDKLMFVGKIVTRQKKKGSTFYYEQCIQAEEIYKNEWEKYYGSYRDWETYCLSSFA